MASMGMSTSGIEEHTTHRLLPSPRGGESTAFAVTQALVSLLAQKGWSYKLLQAQLSADKGDLLCGIYCSKGDLYVAIIIML